MAKSLSCGSLHQILWLRASRGATAWQHARMQQHALTKLDDDYDPQQFGNFEEYCCHQRALLLRDCQSEGERHALATSPAWHALQPCGLCASPAKPSVAEALASERSRGTKRGLGEVEVDQGVGTKRCRGNALETKDEQKVEAREAESRDPLASCTDGTGKEHPDASAPPCTSTAPLYRFGQYIRDPPGLLTRSPLFTSNLLACGDLNQHSRELIWTHGPRRRRLWTEPQPSDTLPVTAASALSSPPGIPPHSCSSASSSDPCGRSQEHKSPAVLLVAHAAHRPRLGVSGTPGTQDDSWQTVLGQPALLSGHAAFLNLHRYLGPRNTRNILYLMAQVSVRMPGCQMVCAGGLLFQCLSSLPLLRWGLRPGSELWQELWMPSTRVYRRLADRQPSDVDLWLICPDEPPGTCLLDRLLGALSSQIANLGYECSVDRQRSLIGLSLQNTIPVQIICRSWSTVSRLLDSFDLDPCRLALDMSGRLWTTKSGWQGLETGVTTVDAAQLHKTPLNRWAKWLARGMAVRILNPRFTECEGQMAALHVRAALVRSAADPKPTGVSILTRALAGLADPELWLRTFDVFTRDKADPRHCDAELLWTWPAFPVWESKGYMHVLEENGQTAPRREPSVLISRALTRLWPIVVRPRRAALSVTLDQCGVDQCCALLTVAERLRWACTSHAFYYAVSTSKCWRTAYLSEYQPLGPYWSDAATFLRRQVPVSGGPTAPSPSSLLRASTGRYWLHLYWRMRTLPMVQATVLVVSGSPVSLVARANHKAWRAALRKRCVDFVYFRFEERLFVISKASVVSEWEPDLGLWKPVCPATGTTEAELAGREPEPQVAEVPDIGGAPPLVVWRNVMSTWGLLRVAWRPGERRMEQCYVVASQRPVLDTDVWSLQGKHSVHWGDNGRPKHSVAKPTGRDALFYAWRFNHLDDAHVVGNVGDRTWTVSHGETVPTNPKEVTYVVAVQVGPRLLIVCKHRDSWFVRVKNEKTLRVHAPQHVYLSVKARQWLTEYEGNYYALVQGGSVLLLPMSNRHKKGDWPKTFLRLCLADLPPLD